MKNRTDLTDGTDPTDLWISGRTQEQDLFSTTTFRCFLGALVLVSVAAFAEPAAKTEAGWQTFSRPADGFSVALPASWQPFELSAADMQASLDQVAARNPELARAFSGQLSTMAASGIKFFAIDAGVDFAKVGFATNLNVLIDRVSPTVALADYLEANHRQLESMDSIVKPVKRREIQLGGHPAGIFEYQMVLDPRAGTKVAITQVFAVTPKGGMVFTFTTLPQLAGEYRRPFADMIGRLRILE